MSITLEQVRSALSPDEPNYSNLQSLGTDALPFLEQLVQGTDAMMASKAASAAGAIGGENAVSVLENAARSPAASVRVAAAAALGQLPPRLGAQTLIRLLGDSDRGVRRLALRSAAGKSDKALRSRIEVVRTSDSDAKLRSQANEILKSSPTPQ
jgi:HEAT repeat protein